MKLRIRIKNQRRYLESIYELFSTIIKCLVKCAILFTLDNLLLTAYMNIFIMRVHTCWCSYTKHRHKNISQGRLDMHFYANSAYVNFVKTILSVCS